jgi:hypothetical protein
MIRILAGLKYLRPAPGEMGVLKSVMADGRQAFLNDSWSWLTQDPTSKSNMHGKASAVD